MTGRGLAFQTAEEVERSAPPAWLVDGIIPEGGLALLYGPSGAGKTFLALDWAGAVGTGLDWLGRFRVRRGAAPYISAEGSGGLPNRITAWRLHHNMTGALGVCFVTVPVQFLDENAVGDLVTKLLAMDGPIRVIVVDTLARCMIGGDENSAKEMGQFIGGLDTLGEATGATVLVIHHSGRVGGHERGSSALFGAADTVMELAEKPEGSGHLTLTCKKQKDAEPFPALHLRRERVDFDREGSAASSCVIVERDATAPERGTELTADHRAILWALAGPSENQRVPGPKLLPLTKLSEATFGRRVQDLKKWDLIEANRQGYKLTPKGWTEASGKGLTITLSSSSVDPHEDGPASSSSPSHPVRGDGEGDGVRAKDDAATAVYPAPLVAFPRAA